MPHYVVDKVADALNTQRKAVNGSQRADRRRRLQARHRRHARVAGARRHGPAARARARRSPTPIRTCRTCTAASGPGGYDLKAVELKRGIDRAVRLRRHRHRPQGVRLRRDGRRSGPDRRHAQRDQEAASATCSSWAPPRPERPGEKRRRSARHARSAALSMAEPHNAMETLFWVSALRRSATSTSGYPLLLAAVGAAGGPAGPRKRRFAAGDLAVDLHRPRRAQRSAAAAGAYRQPARPDLSGPPRDHRRLRRVDRRHRATALAGFGGAVRAHRGAGRRQAAGAQRRRRGGDRRHPRLRRRAAAVRARTPCRRSSRTSPIRGRRRHRRTGPRLRVHGDVGLDDRRRRRRSTGSTRSGCAATRARVWSTLGATGAIYALRRSLLAAAAGRHAARRRAGADARGAGGLARRVRGAGARLRSHVARRGRRSAAQDAHARRQLSDSRAGAAAAAAVRQPGLAAVRVAQGRPAARAVGARSALFVVERGAGRRRSWFTLPRSSPRRPSTARRRRRVARRARSPAGERFARELPVAAGQGGAMSSRSARGRVAFTFVMMNYSARRRAVRAAARPRGVEVSRWSGWSSATARRGITAKRPAARGSVRAGAAATAAAAAPPAGKRAPPAEPRDWAFIGLLAFTALLFFRPQDLIPPLRVLHLAEIAALVALVALISGPAWPRPAASRGSRRSSSASSRFGAVILATAPFSVWMGGAVGTFTDLYVEGRADLRADGEHADLAEAASSSSRG